MHKFREVLHLWPLLVTLTLTPLQTELLIASVPVWGRYVGVGRIVAFLFVAGVATAKMYWGYWFWRWVSHLIADTERFQRVAGVVRQAAVLIRAEGLSDRFFAELKLRHTPERWRAHRVLSMARHAGYAALFGIGATPFFGVRGPFGPILAVAGWRNGVTALALGNVIRIAYMMGGMELLRYVLSIGARP